MITLITGLPGNGKTLYALQWVKAKAEKEDRPVFYAGIKDLKLPWTEIEAVQWHKCPARAIVVIDECQRFFGVRPRGATQPEHCRELETHRHLGIDLVFITQSPMLLDSHDRALMEQHFHVVRKFGLQRATVHEFSPVRDTCLKSRTGSIRHEWSYPKEAFAWYTSAEVHTHKARVPMRVWLLLALPFLLIAVIWVLVAQWMAKINPEPKPSQKPSVTASSQRQPATLPLPEPVSYVESFAPRVPGLAYTAPAYDRSTAPVHAPYPAACVESKTRCQCYTQQGTRLDVPRDMCSSIAAGGFFLAWEPRPQQQAQQARPAPQPVQAGPVGQAVGIVQPAPVYMESAPEPQQTSTPRPGRARPS